MLAWLREHRPDETCLPVPELIYAIHRQTRLSPEAVGEALLRFYAGRRELVTLERTSEVFITGATRGGRVERRRLRFYLRHRDSYISHLILRRPPRLADDEETPRPRPVGDPRTARQIVEGIFAEPSS